jgi:hypothetical protein
VVLVLNPRLIDVSELTLEAQAEAAHQWALVTGTAADYETAAVLYERCDKKWQAQICRTVAGMLRTEEEKDNADTH